METEMLLNLPGGRKLLRDFLFLVLFVMFLAIWLVTWAAFHIAAGAVHLLLALAVIFLLVHFLRKRPV